MLDTHYEYIDELVLRAKSSDTQALSDLYEFYRPLFNAAIKRCVNRDYKLNQYKEDIEQECLLILANLIKNYDSSLSYFSYYLSTRVDYAIFANARKMFLQQNSTGQGIDEILFSEMPDGWEASVSNDPFGHIETNLVLDGAIKKLKISHQQVINLYFYQEMTQDEAASTLGITQTSFSKRLKRAITKLKELFDTEK